MLPNQLKFLLIVLLGFGVDQTSKFISLSLNKVHFNLGLFLGLGDNYFTSSLIIFLGTFSIFLLGLYIFFLTNLGKSYDKLKYTLSLLMAGILGNSFDRIVHGKTIDFIPGIQSYFNLADIYIFVSIAILIYLIFFKEQSVFYKDNIRRKLIVNRKEQFRIGTYFAFASFITSLILGIFLYTFFRYYQPVNPKVLLDFIILFSLLSLLSLIFFFLFGLALSHKSIGALFAFEKYIKDLIQGEDREFQLRENDDFKHLLEIANELRKKINHE